MARHDLTAEHLRKLFCYNPETGLFTNRVNRGAKARIGGPAGCPHSTGYLGVKIHGIRYTMHRLAWLYVTGAWPKYGIDHIDGDSSNNRFSNLRDVPQTVNMQNQKRAHSNNKLGLLGVVRHTDGIRFSAKIYTNKRYNLLGVFDTAEEAYAAYTEAKRRLHHV